MHAFMNITKALGDENRVRIINFLQKNEMCLCQVIEMLQLSPSTVSKHMSILVQAKLVDSRKAGRWRYYRLPSTPSREVAAALQFVHQALVRSAMIRADRKTLHRVMRLDKEQLCLHYKAGERSRDGA